MRSGRAYAALGVVLLPYLIARDPGLVGSLVLVYLWVVVVNITINASTTQLAVALNCGFLGRGGLFGIRG